MSPVHLRQAFCDHLAAALKGAQPKDYAHKLFQNKQSELEAVENVGQLSEIGKEERTTYSKVWQLEMRHRWR